jgi:hypothetical protein
VGAATHRFHAQIRGTEDAIRMRRERMLTTIHPDAPTKLEPKCNEVDYRDHQAIQAR